MRFADDGFVDVYVGTQSTGQGHETAYAMLTSHELGIPIDKIRIRQGDSDTLPDGGGTGGARSLYSEGQAILVTTASRDREGQAGGGGAPGSRGRPTSSSSPKDGRFAVVGTDRGDRHPRPRRRAAASASRPGQPRRCSTRMETAEIEAHTFPNGCHVAEVEVDPETGVVAIPRYIVVDDVGHALNPLIVRGQVHGGVTQGIGQALMERTAFDAESGQLLSARPSWTTRCRAPTTCRTIDVDLIEVPCETNPLGVKGAGEAGAVGSPPAVINALVDALADSAWPASTCRRRPRRCGRRWRPPAPPDAPRRTHEKGAAPVRGPPLLRGARWLLQRHGQVGDLAEVHVAPFLRLATVVDEADVIHARAFRQANGIDRAGCHGVRAQPVRAPVLVGAERGEDLHHRLPALVHQVEGRVARGPRGGRRRALRALLALRRRTLLRLAAIEGQVGDVAQVQVAAFLGRAALAVIDHAHVVHAFALRQADHEGPPRRHGIGAEPVRAPVAVRGRRGIGLVDRAVAAVDQVEGRVAGLGLGRAASPPRARKAAAAAVARRRMSMVRSSSNAGQGARPFRR